MEQRNYCTYFDINYLTRGLITYQTLLEHSSRKISLWVLCLDEKVHDFLRQANFSGIKLVTLTELEAADQALASVKQVRSRAEYYFTCTPCLAKYVLDQNPEVSDITYIDSDLCFFDDPELIYSEIGENSIAITPHRFSSCNKFREQWGIYNVAFNYFRRDEDGLICLNWWRDRCLEWCYDRLEDGKFADQKYLDDWLERFQNVKVLDNPGINLAPWNVGDMQFSKSKKVFVNGLPLIFYHFHGLKKVKPTLFDPNWYIYKIKPCNILISEVYQKYSNKYAEFDKIALKTQTGVNQLREHIPQLPYWFTGDEKKECIFYVISGRLIWLPVSLPSRIIVEILSLFRKSYFFKIIRKRYFESYFSYYH